MDIVLIVIIAIVAIAVIALLVAMSRRSKVAHQERKREVGEARDVAREQHQRAELSEAEKHRARADVAQERAQREKLAAELHETRASNGAAGDPVRDDEATRAGAEQPDAQRTR
jgi:FtsZ-interacting cell division protein ZipA